MQLTDEQKKAIEQQKEHCPFCQIVAGKIPATKVYEDDILIGILDINPASPGHVLVMPKEHYPIMPIIPPDTFKHLFTRVSEITKYLREAMVAKHCAVFIANGAAAGQQSLHFMIHVIPSDRPLSNFTLPEKDSDPAKRQELQRILSHNLPLMMRERTKLFPLPQASPPPEERAPADSRRLAELIEENAEFKRLLMENPQAVLEGIKENPSLQPLFEGVDVMELSKRLNEINNANLPPSPPPDDTPRAADLSDAQLLAFLDEKPKLKELLLQDIESLAHAITQQPKLQHFFDQTTPEAVAARVQQALQVNESRLPAGRTSLDDLAGGKR